MSDHDKHGEDPQYHPAKPSGRVFAEWVRLPKVASLPQITFMVEQSAPSATVPPGWKLVCEKCGISQGEPCGWPAKCEASAVTEIAPKKGDPAGTCGLCGTGLMWYVPHQCPNGAPRAEERRIGWQEVDNYQGVLAFCGTKDATQVFPRSCGIYCVINDKMYAYKLPLPDGPKG